MTMTPQTTPPPLFGNSISHVAFTPDDFSNSVSQPAFTPEDADVPVFVEGQVRCSTCALLTN